MAQYNFNYLLTCEGEFALLQPGHHYWPQIQAFLEQYDLWPPQDPNQYNFYTVAVEEQCLINLGLQFDRLNSEVISLQDYPQLRDLWVRLRQFVGEEVNEENKVMAKFISDLTLTPIIRQICDFLMARFNSIESLVVRMAITLGEHPFALNHIDVRQREAQRRVIAILNVLIDLEELINRGARISGFYLRFMGIDPDLVIGPKEPGEQPPPLPDLVIDLNEPGHQPLPDLLMDFNENFE